MGQTLADNLTLDHYFQEIDINLYLFQDLTANFCSKFALRTRPIDIHVLQYFHPTDLPCKAEPRGAGGSCLRGTI